MGRLLQPLLAHVLLALRNIRGGTVRLLDGRRLCQVLPAGSGGNLRPVGARDCREVVPARQHHDGRPDVRAGGRGLHQVPGDRPTRPTPTAAHQLQVESSGLATQHSVGLHAGQDEAMQGPPGDGGNPPVPAAVLDLPRGAQPQPLAVELGPATVGAGHDNALLLAEQVGKQADPDGRDRLCAVWQLSGLDQLTVWLGFCPVGEEIGDAEGLLESLPVLQGQGARQEEVREGAASRDQVKV